MKSIKGVRYVKGILAFTVAMFALYGCGATTASSESRPGLTAAAENTDSVENGNGRVAAAQILGLQEGFQQGSYAGRFVCPKLKLDVGLYRSDTHNAGANAQQITDRTDSAALMPYGDGAVISDHDFQGFSALLDAVPGEEARILLDGGDVMRLVCVDAQDGEKSMDIRLIDGTSLRDAIGKQQVSVYTCTNEPGTVRVTIWDAYSNGVAGKETSNA